MDTNRLKRFATEARNKIRQGVVNKLLTLGFNAAGEADEFPRQLQGSTLFRGQQLEESFYDKWIALYEAIQKQGLKEVYEEVAYTWFNRFVAIRILQMNGFIDRVLVFDNPDIRVPHIVTEARQGRFPALTTAEQLRLRNIITDPTKTYEQFVILITAFCHTTPILNQCFGSINDYTELLLPNDVLEEGGFVDMLNHTEFISEEDYKTTELLGWLYQFYISERKDEVFASFKKGKKAEAEDIAPATQIFTPNWIVKYMVENTLGRIYLDNNPDADLQEQMAYLVEKAEGNEEAIYHYDQLEDLRVIDPACGSGHILLEAFDLLYAMYLDEFYSREEAITAIFEHNLVGIDLDTRARQLATFALLLKACQLDDSFLDAHSLPKVLDMSRVVPAMTEEELDKACLRFMGGYENVAGEMLAEDFELLRDAQTLGSIMQFNNDPDYLAMLRCNYKECLEEGIENCAEEIQALIPGVEVILALTDQYTAVIANPPYMGAGNMNKVLSEYVKKNYAEGKGDLFSVFMQVAESLLDENGKYGMINMQSWMFLSSFEKLRTHILSQLHIDSMLHLGPRTFDELSGEVVQNTAFVISKHKPLENGGTYHRLVDGNNCRSKEELFLSHRCGNEDGNRIYYPNVSQKNFEKIPGSPVGYWVSENAVNTFVGLGNMNEQGKPSAGLSTTDDKKYLRLWFEVAKKHFSEFSSDSHWTSITKGGGFRRWYGNMEYVVFWKNDGEELRNHPTAVLRNKTLYFINNGISWPDVGSFKASFRYFKKDWLFNNKGPVFFPNQNSLLNNIAFFNSCVSTYYLEILAPTICYNAGAIGNIPYKEADINENMVSQNISISRSDWDAHETSWDFQRNELLTIDAETYADNIQYQIEKHEKETGEHLCIDPTAPELGSLAWRIEQYKQKWEKRFMQLHANEEELNRQFIDIYGLQDELTPDVPLDEVTILQQGEIKITNQYSITDNEGNHYTDSNGNYYTITGETYIDWQEDVLIKQFISYAIGCMMGRYSLDKPGLILANQGDTLKEYLEQVPSPTFMPDEDGILPLMDENSPFPDNVVTRLAEWVKVALGAEWQTANLNCMETALGKSLTDYLAKDFWKDHKKMYQNRPIYWLFSSKKGAFKALVYMHRMDPYIVGKVRNKYLLPYIEWLKAQIDALMARQAELSSTERKLLQQFNKQLEECREYDVRLHEAATHPMNMDLDDGIVVNYAKYGDILSKLK